MWGYELGAVMIKVEKQADGSWGTTEIFRTEEFGDQTKPPLLIDGAKSLYLIEPDTSGFKPLASAELLAVKTGDDWTARMFATQNWGPLALSEGNLLIRDQSRLMCVKVSK